MTEHAPEPAPATARIFQFPAILGLGAAFIFLVFIAFWLMDMDRTLTLLLGATAVLEAVAWATFTLLARKPSDSNESLGA